MGLAALCLLPGLAWANESLDRARAAFGDLEYDQALAAAEEVLAAEGVPPDQRMEAYVLQGSCQAILGDALAAEKAFRLLLRGRPDFELPGETAPKILRVFRAVKLEEDRIRAETAALERKRLADSLALEGGAVGDARGGKPLGFDFQLADPHRAVRAVELGYRRDDQPAVSLLTLDATPDGRWQGAIPPDWTASDEPYQLRYFVRAVGPDGSVLRSFGGEDAPSSLDVAAGRITKPVHQTAWFWVALGVITVGAGAGGYVIWDQANAPPASDLPPVELP